MRALLVIALLAACVAAARAQIWIMAPANQGTIHAVATPPLPPCGVGAVDLSTGCALPTLRGL